MYIDATETGAPQLCDVDDFKRFSVRCPDPQIVVLGDAGTIDCDGFARVKIDWLFLQGPPTPDWRAALQGMLNFAETKGWVNREDSTVRAHVEAA